MVDLHCLDLSGQTGIARYTVELALALERLGEPVRRLAIPRREVRVAGLRVGGHLSVALQNLWTPLRTRDVLHSTHFYAAHPRADVVTVHDCFPEQYADLHGMQGLELRWFRHVYRSVERRKVQYITPTQTVKQTFLSLHAEVDAERVHVTFEGVGGAFRPLAEGEAPHPAFPADTFNILCVADPHPRKRIDWLYEAAHRAEDPRLRVVHVGSEGIDRPAWVAQREREREWARKLGDRLVRLGRLPDAGLAHAYRSADLVVVPSLDEGFGFPPLEALRSGTPVAVTDKPVFHEVLGGQATYFEGPDDLAGVLERATAKGSPTPGERAANHAFVRDTYTWERTAKLTRDVYAHVRG